MIASGKNNTPDVPTLASVLTTTWYPLIVASCNLLALLCLFSLSIEDLYALIELISCSSLLF